MTDEQRVHIICPLQHRDRFVHSLNVADMAKSLAEHYGEDPDRAYTAGLVHDATKNMPTEKHLELFKIGGITLSEIEKNSPKLWHAMSGSVFAKTNLGVEDEGILSAVRYHTTGKGDMTLLEKIVYIADFISAERDFPGVEELRKIAFESLDRAVFIGADFTVSKLKSLGLPVHPDTLQAQDFYREG